MIEIVCPSCGAQYQVPVDSIGPEGRKVTCSSCSHKWRAYAPAAAADPASEDSAEPPAEAAAEHPAEPASAESAAESAAESPAEPTIALTGEPYAERESPAATGADESAAPAAEAHDPSGAGEEAAAAAQPATGGREEQMDAIRRMLDDLKRSAENEPEPEPEPEAPRRPGPEPTMRRRDDEADRAGDEGTGDQDTGVQDRGGDPLRSRIRQLEGGAQPGRPGNYDAARLRKMHERRARRLQKAKERQRKSGAFLTGFTLVAAVTATMVGLYALHPQIIAASPQMEPAMNEYVVTVDRYRIALDEATADWRDWMGERVAQLSGGEDGQEGQAGQAQEPTSTE